MIDNLLLGWKPFGLTMTVGEFEDLLTWYIQKNSSTPLNTKESA